MQSIATDDDKHYQCRNIVLNNKTEPLFFGIQLMDSITDSTDRDGRDIVESADKGMKVFDTPDNSTFRDSSLLRHGSIFGLDPPRR